MIRLDAHSRIAQKHFIPCLSPRAKGCVNPKRRLDLHIPVGNLAEINPFAVALNFQVMRLGELCDELEMIVGANIAKFERPARPPELEAICLPKGNLG